VLKVLTVLGVLQVLVLGVLGVLQVLVLGVLGVLQVLVLGVLGVLAVRKVAGENSATCTQVGLCRF
jgi:hypothetical protein